MKMLLNVLTLLILGYVSCECPSGWSKFKDSCYWASTSSAYSWNGAKTKCKEKGGYLVELGDHEENDFVARMTFGAGNWFFMGILHKEECGGQYVTATDDKPLEYSNWLDSESDNSGSSKCTKLGYLGYWETFPCDEKQYFICESENYIGSSSFGGWLSNTNSFSYDGHYYRTVGKMASYDEAQRMCKEAGAYLVEPNNEGENVFVHDKMHEAFYGHWRYIGATDSAREGFYVWANSGQSLEFENWWPGEPNDKNGEDCMEMRYWGKWNDVGCYNSNRYICERDFESSSTTERVTEETTERRTTTDYLIIK